MAKENSINKARFWTGVLYPENMKDGWELAIGDIVQYPYAYCKHTQDRDSKSEHRKDHVHIILAFPNTTTYKHAMGVFNLLSADGKKAINKCEAVIGIRNVYDYLIHDTEACRKQGKELYDKSERITGNNFDIGAYEQLGTAEKNEMFLELGEAIRDNGFMNYMDFYEFVVDTYEDINYIEVLRIYSGHFERMLRGNFHRGEQGKSIYRATVSQKMKNNTEQHENNTENDVQQHASNTPATHSNTPATHSNTENDTMCCPACGSINTKKSGKTLSKRQRWACKDCGKTFS